MKFIVLTVALAALLAGCAGPSPDTLAAADAAPSILQDPAVRATVEADCRKKPVDSNMRQSIKMAVGKSPATLAEFCRRMAIAMGSGRLSRTQMAELIEGNRISNGTAIVLLKAMQDVPPET